MGVDSSTMEANASMRAIVRRDTGENNLEMLKEMARESGVEAETKEKSASCDWKRGNKSLSNREWASTTDGDARIAKLKDGRTHMAYKGAVTATAVTGGMPRVQFTGLFAFWRRRCECGVGYSLRPCGPPPSRRE